MAKKTSKTKVRLAKSLVGKKVYTIPLRSLTILDVPRAGGKNASLGELLKFLGPKGVRVPDGFVVTADGYRYFLQATGLDKLIRRDLRGLNTKNLNNLAKRGKEIREAIRAAEFPADLAEEIRKRYHAMETQYQTNVDVACRSSATAEDLPGASFAGEHETYLNVRGADNVLNATRAAMASLFNDRAISYRVDKHFDHLKVALSVGVQKMVRSDKGCSGVMFTLDTETGFAGTVVINGAWGLGELIVQGEVTPDEFVVFKSTLKTGHQAILRRKLGVKKQRMVYSGEYGLKAIHLENVPPKARAQFVLSNEEVLTLAKWGILIEEHYSKRSGHWTPMDIEWAKDGLTGEMYVVQARPETVHAGQDFTKVTEYVRQSSGKTLVHGASVGSRIASGKARVILDPKGIRTFKQGEVLVTTMTDPDWEPIMKIAAAIVTDKGGRTSHAAIVSRELGIPCVVGTEFATRRIKTGQVVTVDTTGSEGIVMSGKVPFTTRLHDIKKLPKPKTKIMVNIATPETAFQKSFLPQSGVGLAREEFIIADAIGIHPGALLDYHKIKAEAGKNPEAGKLIRAIDARTAGYEDKTKFYVEKLAEGIGQIGAAFYPKPVIVRFSDFKTNEYRALLGGDRYEPQEENPMIGWRGASRYYHPNFAAAFALECLAMNMVRKGMGLTNVIPMIPFCRTTGEADKVLAIMKKHGLDRAKDKTLKVYVMCEIPSNIVLADKFLDRFDGMSIGSNDLTQLTVGIDRDASVLLRGVANETDEAVESLIAQVIKVCRGRKKYIGICGQGPSDIPEFAAFVVRAGIESVSLNPDTVIPTTIALAKLEKKLHRRK